MDTSYREKNRASSCCSTTDCLSYGQSSCAAHERRHRGVPSVTGSSLMSSVSHSDSISKDSGFSGSVKRKDKHNNNDDLITVTYYLWGEPIPYRTSVPGKSITLGQFKTLLPPRRGNYRWASLFFTMKTYSMSTEEQHLMVCLLLYFTWSVWGGTCITHHQDLRG